MVHTDGGWYYDGDDCILIHVSLLFIVVNRALFWSVTQTSPPPISLVCQSQFLQNNMNTLMSSIFQLICSQVQVGEKTNFPLTKMELACQEVSCLYSLYFPANNELWPQYRLPEVRYYKGSFILDSEHELTGVQQFRRPRWVLQLYLLIFIFSEMFQPLQAVLELPGKWVGRGLSCGSAGCPPPDQSDLHRWQKTTSGPQVEALSSSSTQGLA